MLIAAPTPFNTIFWQFVNQTYNAMFNYHNRNASSAYTSDDIAKSYLIALASSISVGLGVRHVLNARFSKVTGPFYYVMNAFSSFLACGSADFLNTSIMRRTEIEQGINILHPETLEPI